MMKVVENDEMTEEWVPEEPSFCRHLKNDPLKREYRISSR